MSELNLTLLAILENAKLILSDGMNANSVAFLIHCNEDNATEVWGR